MGTHNMRKTFGALALVLIAGTSAVSAQRKINERRAFAPDGSIRIFNAVGTVRVIGWARDSIWVTGTVWEDQDRFMIGKNPHAMKLGVWDYGNGPEIKPSQIEVHVPAGASVWLHAARSRTREPASSITSMALSGMNRPVM